MEKGDRFSQSKRSNRYSSYLIWCGKRFWVFQIYYGLTGLLEILKMFYSQGAQLNISFHFIGVGNGVPNFQRQKPYDERKARIVVPHVLKFINLHQEDFNWERWQILPVVYIILVKSVTPQIIWKIKKSIFLRLKSPFFRNFRSSG